MSVPSKDQAGNGEYDFSLHPDAFEMLKTIKDGKQNDNPSEEGQEKTSM